MEDFTKYQNDPELADILNQQHPKQQLTRAQVHQEAKQYYELYLNELNSNAPDKQAMRHYRDKALELERKYQSMPDDGSEAPESANESEFEFGTDKPTLEQLQAYFSIDVNRQKALGEYAEQVDFNKLDEDQLASIYEQLAEIDQTIGSDNPEEIIAKFNADAESNLEAERQARMARLQQMQDEQERKNQERQAKKEQKEQEKEAKRKYEQQLKAAEKRFNEWQRSEQKKYEKQQAEAKRAQEKQQAAQIKSDQQARADQAKAQLLADNEREAAEAAAAAAAQRRRQTIANLVTQAGVRATNAGQVVATWPQPGGIALLLFTILFIVFALVPMNHSGDTRMQLIWLAMRGKVKLPTSDLTSLKEGDLTGVGGGSNTPIQDIAQGIGNSIARGVAGAGGLGSRPQNVPDPEPFPSANGLLANIPYASRQA